MRNLVKLSVFLFLVSIALPSQAQRRSKRKANEDTMNWKYEIECMGVGVEGTYLIKVWSYSKKTKEAMAQAKKNAIHGVIFKGFLGGVDGCTSQKPLARNSNLFNERKDYFESFFEDNGKFLQFINATNDGSVPVQDVLKIKKRYYKVGVIVSVNKDQLRKELEKAGIIRGLSSGF